MREHTETESSLAAMNRAAVTARERASLFGSKLVLWRDGAVVLVDPKKEGADQPATVPESNPEGTKKPQAEP